MKAVGHVYVEVDVGGDPRLSTFLPFVIAPEVGDTVAIDWANGGIIVGPIVAKE